MPAPTGPAATTSSPSARAPANLPSPHLVFYETTRRCPLACLHCRARAQREPLPGELTGEEAERWIAEAARFGPPLPVLVLTGGDPLARPDLDRLVSAGRRAGLPVAVSPAVSPALTPQRLERLYRIGVSAISLSLDGFRAETHEALRREPGLYAATLEAFRWAKDAGLKVQMNTVVLRSNLEELPDLFALVRDLRLDAWEVFFLVKTGRAEELGDLEPEEYEAVGQFLYDASCYGTVIRPIEAPFLRRIVRQRAAGGRASSSPLFERLTARLRARFGPPTSPTTLRPSGPLDGDGTVFVRYDGAILPGGFAEAPLGNVRADDLVAVYRGHPDLGRIRRREFGGPCGRCPYRAPCGGSRGRALSSEGDLLGSDPACVLAARSHVAREPALPIFPHA